MPKPVRLVVIREGLSQSDALAALNVDTQEQCYIAAPNEVYEFHCDAIGLDDSLAARYTNGLAIAVGMDAEDWQLWREAYPMPADSPSVWLTVSQEGNHGDKALTAMELITKREIIALQEKPAFIADVQGWNEPAYQKNLSFICRMSAENWAAWLDVWEVAEPPYESVALLTA